MLAFGVPEAWRFVFEIDAKGDDKIISKTDAENRPFLSARRKTNQINAIRSFLSRATTSNFKLSRENVQLIQMNAPVICTSLDDRCGMKISVLAKNGWCRSNYTTV
jgi:hypothetical protein